MPIGRLPKGRPALICDCGSHAWQALTKGFVALVSTADARVLSERSWSAHRRKKRVYVAGTRDNATLTLHQRVMEQVPGPPDKLIDHRNGIGVDCRRENLRRGTHYENNLNMRGVYGKVPYKGVSYVPRLKKFKSEIRVQGKGIYLGIFADVLDAAKAYDVAAKKHFGEFAATNEEIVGLRVGA